MVNAKAQKIFLVTQMFMYFLSSKILSKEVILVLFETRNDFFVREICVFHIKSEGFSFREGRPQLLELV